MTNKKRVPWLPADSGTLNKKEVTYHIDDTPTCQCLIKIDASIARIDTMINRLRRHEEAQS